MSYSHCMTNTAATARQTNYIASLYGDRWEHAASAAANADIIGRDAQSISGWQKRPLTSRQASAVIDWLKTR